MPVSSALTASVLPPTWNEMPARPHTLSITRMHRIASEQAFHPQPARLPSFNLKGRIGSTLKVRRKAEHGWLNYGYADWNTSRALV